MLNLTTLNLTMAVLRSAPTPPCSGTEIRRKPSDDTQQHHGLNLWRKLQGIVFHYLKKFEFLKLVDKLGRANTLEAKFELFQVMKRLADDIATHDESFAVSVKRTVLDGTNMRIQFLIRDVLIDEFDLDVSEFPQLTKLSGSIRKDLSHSDFSDLVLDYVDLRDANLFNTNFSNTGLNHVSFNGANIAKANFSGATGHGDIAIIKDMPAQFQLALDRALTNQNAMSGEKTSTLRESLPEDLKRARSCPDRGVPDGQNPGLPLDPAGNDSVGYDIYVANERIPYERRNSVDLVSNNNPDNLAIAVTCQSFTNLVNECSDFSSKYCGVFLKSDQVEVKVSDCFATDREIKIRMQFKMISPPTAHRTAPVADSELTLGFTVKLSDQVANAIQDGSFLDLCYLEKASIDIDEIRVTNPHLLETH